MVVDEIRPGSIAEELGIEPGDIIKKINGVKLRDLIDYKLLEAETSLEVELDKRDGERWILDIEKETEESLGITPQNIVFDGLKLCNNHCIFCFVDQMPKGLRKTLSLKDDDYRFSFLQGSYITLNNISQNELKRIARYRLSPLYISVLTTNPDLRAKMMKNPKAAEILKKLNYLVNEGIEFHAQVVLCPGLNDGDELDRTINDLFQFYPRLLSLALVPVGLTRFRKDLYPLRKYTCSEAVGILKKVSMWQAKSLRKTGRRLLYPSDEFFFLANTPLPSEDYYEGYPQLENGVGLTTKFREEFLSKLNSGTFSEKLFIRGREKERIVIISSELGCKALKPVIELLKSKVDYSVDLYPQKNIFFGDKVTVAGLLTGYDFSAALQKISSLYDLEKVLVVIPGVSLNDQDLFLDDLSLIDLQKRFSGLDIVTADDPEDFLSLLHFRQEVK